MPKKRSTTMRVHGITERYEQPTARTHDGASTSTPMSQFAHLPAPPWNELTTADRDGLLTDNERLLMNEGVPVGYIVERRSNPSWPKRPPFFKPIKK